MSFPVTLHSIGLVESFATYITFVRLYSSMYSFMSVVVGNMGEFLATSTKKSCCKKKISNLFHTIPANIRLNGQVDPSVIFQIINLEKTFLTQVTLVLSLMKMISFNMIIKN